MKTRPTKSDILKKKLVESLEKSLGVVTTACKQTGVNRSTFYEWYNKDEEFKKEVDSIGDIALDFAESQLHKQIKDGNSTATIFYLKTKGKRRGYVERQEITGADGSPTSFKIEIIDTNETPNE
jgi:predicted DNA-binding transcriptional regulator AlpA